MITRYRMGHSVAPGAVNIHCSRSNGSYHTCPAGPWVRWDELPIFMRREFKNGEAGWGILWAMIKWWWKKGE